MAAIQRQVSTQNQNIHPAASSFTLDTFPLTDSELIELRLLTRKAFYAMLGRRVPQHLRSLPSYVRAVQRHFKFETKNPARRILANLEGFDSWTDLVREMMLETGPTG